MDFARHLHERGVPHQVVTHYPPYGGLTSHTVVEVDGRDVDWTARQFNKRASFPQVTSVKARNREEWPRTIPYEADIEYGKKPGE